MDKRLLIFIFAHTLFVTLCVHLLPIFSIFPKLNKNEKVRRAHEYLHGNTIVVIVVLGVAMGYSDVSVAVSFY